MTAEIDNQIRYHLSRNPDGSLLELERTECSCGYLGFDTLEKRFVAFYLVNAEEGPSRKATISLGERVYIASEIGHPCVFALTDYGDYDGQFFYTTELIDGERIEPYIERVGGLPMTVAIDLALQLVRLLRYLGDYPRVLGSINISDVYVSYTPGQSLRIRLGGLGLNKPEVPRTEVQICELWIPDAARVLWKLITASLHGKDGRTLPEQEVQAFLEPFQAFIELLISRRIRHTPDDFYHLEREFTRYAYEYLNVFQKFLLASSPQESAALRPQSFLADLLLKELFMTSWDDHDYIFDSLLISHCSNFAVAAHDTKKKREIQFQVLPPDRLKGSGGLESLHRKMGHPYLMEHPNFVRTFFLRQQDDFLVVAEERVHGFSLAHLIERRGALLSNEALEIMRKLHWILRQVEGIGATAEALRPWNVYFHFPPEIDSQTMAGLLSGTRIRLWPEFEIKLHVGVTTADFLRPNQEVWAETLTRLLEAYREREAEKEMRNSSFVALAAYMMEYQTFWQDLFAETVDERLLTRCSKFNTMAVAAIEPTRDEPKDERNRFLREWEARLDSLGLPSEEIEDDDRMPTILASPDQAAVSPFRDPTAPALVKPPGGQRMTVAGAAAAAAEAANPRKDRIMKTALISLIAISLIGLAFGLGRWLPENEPSKQSTTVESGETLEAAELEPAIISTRDGEP
ncbi:MAG: hypothetical protein ACI8UO_000241 [Verrucomicrobiales bacterium]|jgi:hypothetical protein